MYKSFISFLIVMIICTSLTGCGLTGYTHKQKKMAVEYVQEKYGIKAKAKRVSVDGIDWVTPTWERSKTGIVEMEYKGGLFYVYTDLDLGVDKCTDSYMHDEFCEKISSEFKDIQCDEMNIVVSYTEGIYKYLVGKDILTFDDLIADEHLLGIFVDIYTYRLDPSHLSLIDVSDKPWLSTVRIHDWVDSSFIHSGYDPESYPGVDELIHVCYAEYNADPDKYQGYFDNYENGKFTLKRFQQIQQDDVHISCEENDKLEVTEYQGCPESDYPAITEWYQVTNKGSETNKGAQTNGIIAFRGDLIENFETKICYIEQYDGEKTFVSPLAYNKYLVDFGREYYFTHYTLDENDTMIFRLVAEDK